MIDVYRKQPIDEKSDIWALGVLLYKLCYYTTPFEEVGQMAILNASFKYPAYPQFSDRLKMFIGKVQGRIPEKDFIDSMGFDSINAQRKSAKEAEHIRGGTGSLPDARERSSNSRC